MGEDCRGAAGAALRLCTPRHRGGRGQGARAPPVQRSRGGEEGTARGYCAFGCGFNEVVGDDGGEVEAMENRTSAPPSP